MEIFQAYGKEIVALLVPLIGWLINGSQRSTPKLVRGVRHSFVFLIPEPLVDANGANIAPKQTINTASVVVTNIGKKTANKVEVVFNWKPPFINIWPNRDFAEKVLADHRYIVTFQSLSPAESVGFEILAINAELPQIVNTRCDEGVAKVIQLQPQRVFKRWQQKIFQLLILAGLSSTAYVLILFLQFLTALK
jgi:hypothetical protein